MSLGIEKTGKVRKKTEKSGKNWERNKDFKNYLFQRKETPGKTLKILSLKFFNGEEEGGKKKQFFNLLLKIEIFSLIFFKSQNCLKFIFFKVSCRSWRLLFSYLCLFLYLCQRARLFLILLWVLDHYERMVNVPCVAYCVCTLPIFETNIHETKALVKLAQPSILFPLSLSLSLPSFPFPDSCTEVLISGEREREKRRKSLTNQPVRAQ